MITASAVAGEIVTPDTDAQQRHADRLHAELSVTPCSPRCAVWQLYGIQPAGRHLQNGARALQGRAHRRSTLGLSGRRVLVSRKWSGKTLADHRADRMAFVAQALAAVGIEKAARDTSGFIWRKLAPGDPNVPPGRTCSCRPSLNASPGEPNTIARC